MTRKVDTLCVISRSERPAAPQAAQGGGKVGTVPNGAHGGPEARSGGRQRTPVAGIRGPGRKLTHYPLSATLAGRATGRF